LMIAAGFSPVRSISSKTILAIFPRSRRIDGADQRRQIIRAMVQFSIFLPEFLSARKRSPMIQFADARGFSDALAHISK